MTGYYFYSRYVDQPQHKNTGNYDGRWRGLCTHDLVKNIFNLINKDQLHSFWSYTGLIPVQKNQNESPRGKQRGIKIPAAQDKSRSKLRGTNPNRD